MTEPLQQVTARIYPHSGTCQRCLRERDDLFWHAEDQAFYCADVFRCEWRYYIQGERAAAGVSAEPAPAQEQTQ